MPTNSELASRIRELVDPEKVRDDRVRGGAQRLFSLPDQALCDLFERACVYRQDLDQVCAWLVPLLENPVPDDSLTLALRRFTYKTIPLARELRSFEDSEEDSEQGRFIRMRDGSVQAPAPSSRKVEVVEHQGAAVPPKFTREMDFDNLVRRCRMLSIHFDAYQELLDISLFTKMRLFRMIEEAGRLPSGFLSAKIINDTTVVYKNLLQTILDVQMELGLLRRKPKELDLRIENSFSTYIESVDPRTKEDLIRIGTNFVDMVDGMEKSLKSQALLVEECDE